MPWTAKTFTAKHWNAATPIEAARAARTANAIIAAGGDEGRAIATGIKLAKKRTSKKASRARGPRGTRK
jgi:uncharacterized protein YdaT